MKQKKRYDSNKTKNMILNNEAIKASEIKNIDSNRLNVMIEAFIKKGNDIEKLSPTKEERYVILVNPNNVLDENMCVY